MEKRWDWFIKKSGQGKIDFQLKLILLFFILAAILFLALNGVKKHHEQKHLLLLTEQYERAFNTIYDQHKQLATTIASGILERFAIPDFYQKLLTADEEQKNKLRAELLDQLSSRYKELQQEAKLRQLHFHLSNNESFLRLHRPEKFGDNLTDIRPTVNYVNTEHKPIDGYEEGKIFNGFRFVFPITSPKQMHLGSIEISFGPNALTSSMMRQYNVFCNFLISERMARKKVFPDEQDQNYLQSPHDGYLYDKSVLAVLEDTTHKKMKELRPKKHITDQIFTNAHMGHPMSIYDPSIDMVFTTIPVMNPITGDMVAFLTIRSQSSFFMHERQHFWNFFLISLVLLVMVLFTYSQQRNKRKFFEENSKQLEKQKKQLIGAQEIANLGHWELNLVTNHLNWSRQIYRIFDVDPTEFSFTVDSFFEMVHPDDRDFVHTAFHNHVEKLLPYDIEHRILTKNNKEKWVRETCTTEYSEGGDPIRSLGIVHDITKNHKAMALLQREREIFIQGPVMTFTWQNRQNWPIEQVSANVFEILGYSAQEFLEGSVVYSSLIHDDDLTRVLSEVKTASRQKVKAFHHAPYRLITSHGNAVWVQDHTTIIRDNNGDITHYQGYLVNITDTMNITEELRENRERLELVISGANLGTWDWNIKTGEVLFNERWAEMLGYGLEEIEPDISAWEKLVHPDEQDEITRTLTNHLEGRTQVYMTEHRLRHKSGKWVWVLDAGKVFKRDKDGSPVRAVGIHLDITEQKEIENLLKSAKEAAESANRAKSVFLSNMSHELRTPLNAILGYTQIFNGDASLTPKQQSGIQTIHKSGEHLLMLINDILDLSKIEADKMELVKTEFHLPEFLDSITDIIQIKSHTKRIDFHLDLGKSLPSVIIADELRLRQVLLNLLSNAVKFTSKGHCTLRVQSQETTHNRAELTITVEDSGVGIAPEMLDRVFDPFQQTGERLQYAEGFGLGLTICRKLVHLMGGELQLESPVNESPQSGEGKGCRLSFTIEVTVLDKDMGVTDKTRTVTGYTVPGEKHSQKKILIVDDDAINRLVLRDTLEPLGFVIEEVTDGSEVLEACERYHPDAILMDLLMPETDGYTAIAEIREQKDLSDIPVIAITALTDKGDKLRQRCLEHGFNDCVTKPHSIVELLKILSDHLHISLQYATDNQAAPFDESEIVFPPQNLMEIFIDLVHSGDITGVAQKAGEVEMIESGRYRYFARRIQQLADDYQLIEIEKLLSSCEEK